jgi:hypothetical protein
MDQQTGPEMPWPEVQPPVRLKDRASVHVGNDPKKVRE